MPDGLAIGDIVTFHGLWGTVVSLTWEGKSSHVSVHWDGLSGPSPAAPENLQRVWVPDLTDRNAVLEWLDG
jgi:hypothetical protein